ncbi:ABC transporter permease [Rubellimicrobium sp. CFH 75288]|uniref:ABC transporter permease n=1 Tax=Rubellimicrobium sp. CFH 75288 TaxID=2697034 RepID=UPI001412921D|nr:ABC transporter permease [Rubellimicrobium sp. CFH 75288]NAZ35931.1 ABC transporter permease [Rubellimicrobium sp. CFH 75288]
MTASLRRYATLLGFAAILVGFSVALPGTFPTARNLLNITQQVSMLAVVAFAMTAVMAMGDFDLSVGAMASLAGVVAASLFAAGWSIPAGIAAALAVGLAGGVVNGVLVAYLGILPFVATLGTLTIFSGSSFLVSGGRTIFGGAIPAGFGAFARGGVEIVGLRIPNLTLVALAVLLVLWVLLEHTSYGRRLYAIGGNAEAARLAGIRVRPLRASAFAITGLGAAMAGLMYASRVASANPTQGDGLMLDAIAAVFLGMTMSEESEPRIFGTLVGVLILATLNNGLTQLAVDSYVRQILVGAIILAAVASSRLGLSRG